MRIDGVPPRTWLLAAVAGVAVLAWLLAVAGVGGRVAPLDADPGLLAPLPPMPAAAAARLGPADAYAAIAERPLFSPDRTPQPFFLEGTGVDGDTGGFNYVLTSVLLTPQIQLAILQPPDGSVSYRVPLNHGPMPHPAWQLVELDQRSAVFDGPEGRRTLELRVFDGVGGRPPSILGGADAAVDGQRRAPVAPTAHSAGAAREPDRSDDSSPAVRDPSPAPGSVDDAAQAGPDTAGDSAAEADQPTTDAAQMDAIRQRIQARREAMRNPPPPKPPANNR